MKNTIKYYYNIDVIDINHNNNIYILKTKDKIYNFTIIDNNYNEKDILNIDKYSKYNILIYPIIKNKNNNYISIYNNNKYILLEITINTNKKISLEEITFVSRAKINENTNINWGELWSIKIDYLEKQINENSKKYPMLTDTFNFFTGLCENAISYYNNIKKESYTPVISHKVIKYSIECLYNPLNIILDHKSRDIAEYIKLSFFTNNKYIFKQLSIYFRYNFYSKIDLERLFARVLYPSFYFNLYDEIILGIKKEKELSKLITLIPSYITYINNIYIFLNKYHHIEEVSWISQH